MVSDFLSECWSKLRSQNRVQRAQGRVYLGGALSGRDIEAVTKTVSGLVKLLFPKPDMPVADDDLEWIVRLALESRDVSKNNRSVASRASSGTLTSVTQWAWRGWSNLSRLPNYTVTKQLKAIRSHLDKFGPRAREHQKPVPASTASK